MPVISCGISFTTLLLLPLLCHNSNHNNVARRRRDRQPVKGDRCIRDRRVAAASAVVVGVSPHAMNDVEIGRLLCSLVLNPCKHTNNSYLNNLRVDLNNYKQCYASWNSSWQGLR